MLSTRACEVLGIAHPIVQAGMARDYTSAELIAAVSNAGGLGILGCLRKRFRPAKPVRSRLLNPRRSRRLERRMWKPYWNCRLPIAIASSSLVT